MREQASESHLGRTFLPASCMISPARKVRVAPSSQPQATWAQPGGRAFGVPQSIEFPCDGEISFVRAVLAVQLILRVPFPHRDKGQSELPAAPTESGEGKRSLFAATLTVSPPPPCPIIIGTVGTDRRDSSQLARAAFDRVILISITILRDYYFKYIEF